MFTWLFAIPFIGSFIQIITPAIKGIVEGVVEYIKACWYGVKTSNYGTWTLVLTAVATTWMLTTCPPCKAITKETASKTSTSTGSTPSDIFNHWFK